MPPSQVNVRLAKEICTYLVHMFGTSGYLPLSSEAQYGAQSTATSTDAALATVVETATIQPFVDDPSRLGYTGSIIEAEFVLAAALRTSTDAAAVCTYKYQVKELDLSSTCWVDLTSWTTTAPGTTYLDVSPNAGRFLVQTNFQKVPIQVRMLLFNGTAGSTQATAKTKNASYCKLLYRVE
jgi:hypothetical protein